jgi:BirA family biotin operon repressor/biotin-[acetyl-CoA-carboxylase] ligase
MVPAEHRLLPLAVPLAVCEAAETLVPGVRCQVKWPNDVWVEGRKLAGILIESRPDLEGTGWAVIGVGLNVSVAAEDCPEELRETATSLALAGGGGTPPEIEAVRSALDSALGRWIDSADDAVLAAYRERDGLRGRAISWDGGAGTAAGIDDSGHLLVDTETERVALGAGEVHLTLG